MSEPLAVASEGLTSHEKPKTHLLFVAHAPLASAFRTLALHAFPDAAPDITASDIDEGLSIEDASDQLTAVLAQLDRPLLVLTDVLGATPANALQQALRTRPEVPIVSGLNLAMIWRALGYRQEAPSKLGQLASEGGARSIELHLKPHEPAQPDPC